MKSSIIAHFTAAMLFSLIVGLIYATVQQTYRTAANDPQTGIARDVAHHIRYARTYYYLSDTGIDAGRSLGTFMQLYNQDGKLICSGGTINGKAPAIPKGVLNNAKQSAENAVTWQPASNVRLAAVAAYTGSPDTTFVVVARSLQEVESRESRLVRMILAAWALGLFIIGVHWLVQNKINY